MSVRLAQSLGVAVLSMIGLFFADRVSAQAARYDIVGDGIPKSLTGTPGNAARGKALLIKREQANCLKCHSISQKELAGGGNKGPSLDGVGAALTTPQLRLSVVDLSRVTSGTAMPSFHKSGGEPPKLNAQEVEDVVAFLATLRK